MRIVLALGGNALLGRGEPATAPNQRRNVEAAAAAVAEVAREHEAIVTHGNGPQVGLLALQNEAFPDIPSYPLDVLDAESEGMVGHMLELALRNELPERDVVSVLTEVVVAADDPAFLEPSQAVGPLYGEALAQRLRLDRGWTMGRDDGGYRRLVPAPEPHAIAEIRSLRALLESGALVVCAGGGGIPVALDGLGTMHGVEAVVDKDLTAALLARRLDADLLLMLTDVGSVKRDWGGPNERPIGEVEPAELRELSFAAGSMAPKVEAACRFAEATGRRAAIGALTDAVRVVRGEAGTQIVAPAAEPAIAAARRLPRR
ncbi:MAG TPA: carbamate kinase [Solirubrobacterales bacterium]|nr:carbamate kinase [Solirubrobacterales bacterium]